MFDLLIQNHGVRCSIGMKSGGMDGPGLFFGLPTISFTFRRNSSRVQKIKQTIGNFDLILLDGSHKGTFKKHTLPELEKLRRLLREWGEIDRQTECASS
jgi:hypothetical protein